jgi:pimeloyl-ACP methyl ester carboxylesterase
MLSAKNLPIMTDGIVTPSVRNTELTARASGGRAIGYAEFGDPKGTPVLLFHGFGDSRLTRYPDDELTARLGVRLITFDRPGIGRTDPMKELTILDRTDDVIDLVNSLGLQKFAVLGWSGGAPFALAAAGCIPERVTRVGIAGGFGPFERGGFKRLAPRELRRVMTILKVAPWMSTVMASESEKQLRNGGGGAIGMDSGLGSTSDASLLNSSDIRSVVTAGAEEAFRQGPAGIASDMLLLFRFKWGFNPEDVKRPVELFYGEDDHVTPVEVGRGLASILPDARLRTKPGAGHLLYLRYWEEILHTLIEEPAARVVAPAPIFAPAEAAPAATLSAEEAPTPALPAEEPEPVASEPAGLQHAPAWSWAIPAKFPEWGSKGAPGAEPAAPAQTDEETAGEAVASEHAAAVPSTPTLDSAPAAAPERRPAPEPAPADEIARLRAAGFLLDEPEPAEATEEVEQKAEEAEAAPVPGAETAATVAPAVGEPAGAEPQAEQSAVEEPVTTEPSPAEPKRATPRKPRARTRKAKAPKIAAEAAQTPVDEAVSEPVVQAEPEPAAPVVETIGDAATVAAAAEPAGVEAAAAQRASAEKPAAEAAREPEPVAAAVESPVRSADDDQAERLRAAGFELPDPDAVTKPAGVSARMRDVSAGELAGADRLRAAGFELPEPESASGFATQLPDTVAAEPARDDVAEPAPSGWVSEEIAALVEMPHEVTEDAPATGEPEAAEPEAEIGKAEAPVATEPQAAERETSESLQAGAASDDERPDAEPETPHTPEELAMIERLRAAGYLGIGR